MSHGIEIETELTGQKINQKIQGYVKYFKFFRFVFKNFYGRVSDEPKTCHSFHVCHKVNQFLAGCGF